MDAEAKEFMELAKKYGYAGHVLNNEIFRSRTASERPAREHDAYSYLWVPSLHLSAHALECTLKACACLNGVEPLRSRKEGHDLNMMLRQPYAVALRRRISCAAEKSANALQDIPAYDNLDFRDPVEWIEGALTVLGKLHLEAGSKLRYGSDNPEEQAPSSPLLAHCIYLVTQELGHAPHLLISR